MVDLNFKDFLTSGALLELGPDSVLVMMGPFKQAKLNEALSSESARFLYSPDFWDFRKSASSDSAFVVYKPQSEFLMNRVDFIGLLNQQKAVRPELKWGAVQEMSFAEQFEWSFSEFKSGRLQKTVPIICQKADSKLDVSNKVFMLQSLFKTEAFGWNYAFFDTQMSFIGRSPERLVQWRVGDSNARSVALAGTLPFSTDAAQTIMNDKKIRREHDIVVRDLISKLKEFKTKVTDTQALELKHLVHLKTDVSFVCATAREAVIAAQQLHPTAAMGIFPDNSEAYGKFAEFKIQKERKSFAAPFGFINKTGVELVVGIRNIIFQDESAAIFSGCGVTSESSYDDELRELENKRNSVKKMLGLSGD